ncbi:hypothetical protein [Beggiatoa leptomitoformis]|uniref:VCBS repeat-containing protein n=1 Tax=Beggiatoa leptomitoformis TaxID=288004 RepID=A0A2N9YIH7_9GAMM|nr:hypothetical protein [Beggiatoa leptomitoformis]ALG67455.1 hypothetical protein AL038_06740 [Beggiatoa leptomitoformis]AUI70328.1 hypothetical protein BLE401_17565 [Beggiatoa leptomitoformis]
MKQFFTLIILSFFITPIANAAYVNKDHQQCRDTSSDVFEPIYTGTQLVKEQTFSLTLPLLGDTCFLTVREPKKEKTYFLLTTSEGKLLHRFDISNTDAFNAGCNLLAVGFEEVNNDGQTDIIMVSQCRTKVGNTNYNNVLFTSQATGWQLDSVSSKAISRYKTFADIRNYLRDYPPNKTANSSSDGNEKPSNNSKKETDTKTSADKSTENKGLTIRGELEFDTDGFSLIPTTEANTIYLFKQYPKRLDEQKDDFLGKPLIITGKLLNTEQRGVLTYKTLNVSDVKAE